MDLAIRVKNKIRKLINQRKWTIYELAQRSELTEACIRNWCTKRNYTPSLEAIEKICKALDISVAELVHDESENLMVVNDEKLQLLENWSELEEKQKKVILMQIDVFLDKN